MKQEELTLEYILDLVQDRVDAEKVPDWKCVVYSPNYDKLPKVYFTSVDDAYDFYNLCITWGVHQEWSGGLKFRLDDRDGGVLDEGTVMDTPSAKGTFVS